MKINFPRRHQDGSFCVIASFTVNTRDPGKLLSEIRAWFIEWTENNQIWVWKYDSGREDTFVFNDEFKSIPTAVSCDSGELRIRLEGSPTSQRFWRDWLALRIVPELLGSFPEIKKMTNVRDCE